MICTLKDGDALLPIPKYYHSSLSRYIITDIKPLYVPTARANSH